jgi:hypothetical protein
MSNDKVEATFHDGGNHTPERPGENAKAAQRCPDGECSLVWEFARGTSFGIPSCQICKQINGYALQDELNDKLAAERDWTLAQVKDRLVLIPPAPFTMKKLLDIINAVRIQGAKRRRGDATP